jgi:hypothetical protein
MPHKVWDSAIEKEQWLERLRAAGWKWNFYIEQFRLATRQAAARETTDA